MHSPYQPEGFSVLKREERRRMLSIETRRLRAFAPLYPYNNNPKVYELAKKLEEEAKI